MTGEGGYSDAAQHPASTLISTANLRWRPIVFAVSLASLLAHADRWIVPAVLPAMAYDYGVSIPVISRVVSAYLLAYGVLQLAYGPLADRFGQSKVILVALALMSLAVVVSSIAWSLAALLAIRIVAAVGAAGIGPLGVSLLARIAPAAEKPRALGGFMSVSYSGMLISLAVGATIAALVGWRLVFLAFGLLGIALLGITLFLFRHGTGDARQEISPVDCYRLLLRAPRAISIYPMIAFEGFLVNGLFSFLSGYLKGELKAGGVESAAVLSLFGVAAVIAGPLTKGVWSGSSLNRSTAMAAGVGMVGCVLLFAMPASVVSAALASLLLGASFIVGQNAFMSATCELGEAFRSTSMAMVALCFMGGGALGVQAASTIVAHSSYRFLFGTWSLATFASMALCYLLLRAGAPKTSSLSLMRRLKGGRSN